MHKHTHIHHRKIPNVCAHGTHALVYVIEKIENSIIKSTHFIQGHNVMING